METDGKGISGADSGLVYEDIDHDIESDHEDGGAGDGE